MPPAREALPLIAKPENRFYAIPVSEAYRGADDEFGNIFARVNSELYPKERRGQLIDYGASMNARQRGPAFESGARACLEGAVKLIRQLTVTTRAEKEVQALLAPVRDFDEPQPPLAAPSAALTQFLTAGYQNAGGALNPVAVVTARDLLAYAWESTALQFRSLMRHLSLSNEDKANEIAKAWYNQGEGWRLFMGTSRGISPLPLPETGRLEFIEQYRTGAALIMAPPAAWPQTPDASFRRRWLIQPHESVEFALLHQGKEESLRPLLQRLAEEAHPHVLGPVLRHIEVQTKDIVDHPRWEFDRVIEKLGLRDELIKADPVNVVGPLTAIRHKYADDPWTCAREMEKLHWESGVAIAPKHVFHQYVCAHAFKSANHFFDRWKGVLADWSEFSLTFAQGHFALAMLQSDAGQADQALQIMRGGTWDRSSEMAWALYNKKPDDARKIMEKEMRDSAWDLAAKPSQQQFIDALPLIPALNDPQHPDHEKALDAFPRVPQFLLPEWVLLSKAKLPPNEAERFLGPNVSEERKLIVLALQGRVEEFEKLYAWVMDPDRITEEPGMYDSRERELRGGGARATLYAWLRVLLLKIPAPKEEPDLMPPNAEPVLATLRKIAAERQPAGEK